MSVLDSPKRLQIYPRFIKRKFGVSELFNDTHRGNLFYSYQYHSGGLAAPDLFHMFTQAIKFYAFHYHVSKSTDVWRIVIHQIESKNEWLLLSAILG